MQNTSPIKEIVFEGLTVASLLHVKIKIDWNIELVFCTLKVANYILYSKYFLYLITKYNQSKVKSSDFPRKTY